MTRHHGGFGFEHRFQDGVHVADVLVVFPANPSGRKQDFTDVAPLLNTSSQQNMSVFDQKRHLRDGEMTD